MKSEHEEPKSDYDRQLGEVNENHYRWRCPFDNSECGNSIKGLRFGVCCDGFRKCPRFDEKVHVFRCPFDSHHLPCNIFVDHFGFGACHDKDFGGKVRVCCLRFPSGRKWIEVL